MIAVAKLSADVTLPEQIQHSSLIAAINSQPKQHYPGSARNHGGAANRSGAGAFTLHQNLALPQHPE